MKTQIVKVRKNASQAAIDKAIAQLQSDWQAQSETAPVLFYEGDYPVLDLPDTYYLQVGDVIRYGYSNGFWAWGFGKNEIDRQIAGQKEYAYSQAS